MHQLAFEGHNLEASVLYFRDETGQSFELPVSEELLRILGTHHNATNAAKTASGAPDSAVTIIDESEPTAAGDDSNTGTASNAHGDAGTDDAGTDAATSTNTDARTNAEGSVSQPNQAAGSEQSQPSSERPGLSAVPEVPHMVPTKASGVPDRERPRNRPMSMRPNQIQQRIRAGASAQELADEMGVEVSRVEPFAHPVVLERERIAELAKQAHPVRDGGPDRLTLWEVLATAFAARGHSLADSHWDAHRSVTGEPWTIEVSWTAGLSQNSAQWLFHRHPTSADTVEPRNSVAADLVDPDFIQPVRSVTSLTRSQRVDDDAQDAFNAGFDGIISGDPLAEDELAAHKKRKRGASHPLQTADTSQNAVDNSGPADDDEDTRDDIPVVKDSDERPAQDSARGADSDDDEFLQHPESEAPKKRRRKATTPHWEDVLLGVRANTKRPRR
ncbi:septation protein SepH [Corynebacterium sp.]|uniref:septation protein SepH n=1 Tax=Corynebacterium sp. TaxID=1720 RepID=UPI0027BA913D|nr:septation protein SepH [Corynebacterium sp.]